MSCEDSKRASHRQRQARYEARLRDGIALYPVTLGAIVDAEPCGSDDLDGS
jgi:hypothetical protein